ncbi:hypothetical protein NUW54_g392 [Trametes sanguinea]|uniref:Uncharacterized protein n=1 Tax=Trametes sanguinea TaxID=158606 RepID=A0ACC1QB53_9APHY|nr:hypothetical protein NUW54_g392 [Trametes sanguinea]
MNAQREAGGSVLGKRSHQIAHVEPLDADVVCGLQDAQALPTPDSTPNPKRAKTTTTVLDGDHNKENIPPFIFRPINGSPSSRVTRTLRRTSTMVAGAAMRSPSTPRRYASASDLRTAAVVADTPASSFAQLSLTTPPPTPPTSLLPIHVRARALLRPTCNDTPQFAGRSSERQRIESFVIGFLASRIDPDAPSTLYVSGSPGTGKTALVNAVLASLDLKLQAQGTQVLSINCMALDGVDAVWQRLAETLGSAAKATGRSRRAKASPKQTIENALSASERKCIIVLDELDHIASSSQALTPLFNLASTYSSCLRLIGIANTHTLTSSSCTTLSVQSMIGVDTLHFSPYTPEQLLDILQTRLAPLSQGEDSSCAERAKKFLPLPTLTLLSKKIAAQTGDVRAVFEVLRGAIDIAVTAATSPDPLSVPTPAVTPSHILSALKAYAPAGKTDPLATAIRSYCEQNGAAGHSASSVEETPGRGLKGLFSSLGCTAIIGNEAWMEEHQACVDGRLADLLHTWKDEGKSVVLLAAQREAADPSAHFVVLAAFAVADPIRPEAKRVIAKLHEQGLGTWMISGDNTMTAKAVARSVGIPETNVIAEVLPHQKAEKVQWLQQVGMKRPQRGLARIFGRNRLNDRCIVAMVGDGINDAPALTAADVGIAIGSGSDVAISSASFILFWASIYNIIALPIAAGVIYPAGHARLPPVWASLAMALSSVSVV